MTEGSEEWNRNKVWHENCTYTHMHMLKHIYIHMHPHRTHMHTYPHIHTHTHTHMHNTSSHIPPLPPPHTYTHIHNIYPHVFTHVDSLNQSSLDVIERAQFVLCLDRGHPSTSSLSPHSPFSDPHSTVVAIRSLHGNGSDFNSGNRWFDCSVQVPLVVYMALRHS